MNNLIESFMADLDKFAIKYIGLHAYGLSIITTYLT